MYDRDRKKIEEKSFTFIAVNFIAVNFIAEHLLCSHFESRRIRDAN